MNCSSEYSCSSSGVQAGSGSFDLSCLGNAGCNGMIFTAASGPVSISCLDPDNQGNEPCADIIFYGGSGPIFPPLFVCPPLASVPNSATVPPRPANTVCGIWRRAPALPVILAGLE